MQSVRPDVTVEHARPAVVCLHSSASSPRQWRRLGEQWPGFDVATPNLLGYGDQSWQPGRPHDMADEVRVARAAVESCGRPVHLIGHSFGGAVAILLALEVPRRIRTLTLFEPVLFPLLYEAAEDSGREVWLLQTDVRRLVKRHRCREAAERFVDYWNGTGAFRNMAERAQEAVTRMVPKVASEFAALISSPIAESDLRELRVPTLLLYGERSPASTRDISRLLARILPCRQQLGFEGLGHMGPVEDPERVNAAIAAFIGRHTVPRFA
jgi:pimeloyl-ACP methyl ester carboxylesterase